MRLGFVCADLSAIIYFVRAILVQLNSNLFFFLSGADPCYPNPCTYGGKCEQTKDSFTCNCPPGRVGELCEGKRLETL